MKASQFLINNNSKFNQAYIKSHKYMLRTSMISQIAPGIYIYGPLGIYILKQIENVIRHQLEKNNVIEFLSPIMQPSEIWKESGRYDAYGDEALRIKDRHGQEYIYGPTAEEISVYLMKNFNNKNISIYQIQWKFRDEIRPRYGTIRSREFLMKDAYSFNTSHEEALKTYIMFFNIYMDIFSELELTVYPFEAESGPIGGSYTHEFNILSDIGDSSLYYDRKIYPNLQFHEYDYMGKTFGEGICQSKGIEIGQIFLIGDKYLPNTIMGCYGIGVSRIIAAMIEDKFDGERMYWPDKVRMFDFGIINGDNSERAINIYNSLQDKKILYDDREINIKDKIDDMKLIGIKHIIVIRENEISYLDGKKWINLNDIHHLL